jgi:hypothetical protein
LDQNASDAPDWEILNLLREVRRRIRAGNAARMVEQLAEEPRWVTALPEAEAKVARTMLAATRELAAKAQRPVEPTMDPLSGPVAVNASRVGAVEVAVAGAKKAPRRTRTRR